MGTAVAHCSCVFPLLPLGTRLRLMKGLAVALRCYAGLAWSTRGELVIHAEWRWEGWLREEPDPVAGGALCSAVRAGSSSWMAEVWRRVDDVRLMLLEGRLA